MQRWFVFVLVLVLLGGCAPQKPPSLSPGAVQQPWLRPYRVNGKTYYPLPSSKGYVEVGYASWYGAKFHGRFTASGERYNMYAFTAAHRLLPLGTYVQVTNLENGRQVIVRINDRGPFVKDRILDLSYAAAKALGMAKKGVALVRVVALGEASPRAGRLVFKDIERVQRGQFFLQVGAFNNYANAVALKNRLAKQYRIVLIEPFSQKGKTFYRVQIFLASDLSTARALAHRLAHKFPTAFLVAK